MNNNFRYIMAGILIFLIILLQPIYLKWLGYDSKAVSDEFVPNTSEIVISPNLAIDEKFDNPTLKSEIPESFITIVTPLYTATISNRCSDYPLLAG